MDAEACAIGGGDAGEFAQGEEERTVETDQCGVGDDERPFAGFEFGEEELGVGDDAEAPAFGVEDLPEGALA